MSWLGRRSLQILLATILLGALLPALGPEFIARNFEQCLVSAWKSVGDLIIRRDLGSLSRQLDEERELVSRMRMSRNALVTRLQIQESRSFQDRIQEVNRTDFRPTVFVTGGPWDTADYGQEPNRPSQERFEGDTEPAEADDGLASVAALINQIDHWIERAERALRAKERHLFVLQATTEAEQIRQELAAPGDPLSWTARAQRLAELVQPTGVTTGDRIP
jgi:hypothetical protein